MGNNQTRTAGAKPAKSKGKDALLAPHGDATASQQAASGQRLASGSKNASRSGSHLPSQGSTGGRSPRDRSPAREPPTRAAAQAAAQAAADACSSHPFHAPLDHFREEERPLHDLAASTNFDMATLRKLLVVFEEIAASDADDGLIDSAELTEAMGLRDASALLARALFRLFERTHNKQIDFPNWVRTLSALAPQAALEDKIRFSFQLYDLNNDGKIEMSELRAMLEAAVKDENVLHLSEEDLREWCDYTLRAVDADGNGHVDYQEYRACVAASPRFLRTFTLDIAALVAGVHFKKRKSAEKMSSQEAGQRLLWFRARQRVHGSADGSSSGESSGHSKDGSERGGRYLADLRGNVCESMYAKLTLSLSRSVDACHRRRVERGNKEL